MTTEDAKAINLIAESLLETFNNCKIFVLLGLDIALINAHVR